MPKRSPLLPEVFLSSRQTAARVSRAVARGEIRKIGPRLYTTRTTDDPGAVIRGNLWRIVGLYAPGGVIGYRTAIEGRPTTDSTVFLSGNRARRVDLATLHIRILPGPGPLDGDREFVGSLFYASRARALLEALKPSRARAGQARGLAHAAVEALLDRELEVASEARLNELRDRARAIAPALDAVDELTVLEEIIGGLLGTRALPVHAPIAKGRLSAPAYDAKRVRVFEDLHGALVAAALPTRPDPAPSGTSFRNLSFLDAYFSNYIEGTEFEIEEARAIVLEGRIMATRPADSHDVLGTYHLVGDPVFLATSVQRLPDADAFITRLKLAHATILAGRPEQDPGILKSRPNRAGSSVFVHPDHVIGTLGEGFVIARALENAFARAAALMFIISEVHPFTDGNGRVARALMNAELFAARECRIIIPTVFRDDYVTALRAVTRQSHTEPFVRALEFAQRFTASIEYADLDDAIATLEACNAFDDPAEGSRLTVAGGRQA